MTPRNGHTARIERLTLDQLTIDHRIQRPLRPAHVSNIAEHLDFNALGILVVSRRNDGTIVVLDGQQRQAALRQKGYDGRFSIQCEVHDGLTLAQEAELFLRYNRDRKAVDSLTIYKNRVQSGDPVAVAIDLIVKECGLRVGGSGSEGEVRAVSALEAVYKGYKLKQEQPQALRAALVAVTEAWGANARSLQGQIIEGIGKVFVRDGDAIDADNLIKKLAKYPGGADTLIGDARGRTRYNGKSVTDSVAAIIVDVYNKGRRSNVLEEWR
ncbi:MAG: hypothetical protein JXP37_08540 [Coriobacteriia bacterium]|nr:hypothetical protein [Coriobacteriia bacterium]